jgi:DNA polymerase elongation subunit (family B)
MEQVFRLYDFNVLNQNKENNDEDEFQATTKFEDSSIFLIQMFGINEKGETCSIIAENFKPFFYVKVDEHWDIKIKIEFLNFIKVKIGKYYENSITECKIIKKNKLYGFDNNKQHKFIIFYFENIQCFNKVKNLWYDKNRKLLKNGLLFKNTFTQLYEANIPPLLRFFHIKNISPSGWIALPNRKLIEIKKEKKTTCTFEYIINYKHIIPLNENEKRVPYKICSFDIEASSSHGDFPVPIKSYKKLATNIIDYFDKYDNPLSKNEFCIILKKLILTSFGYDFDVTYKNDIDIIYPKTKTSIELINQNIDRFLNSYIRSSNDTTDLENQLTIEEMFEKMNIYEYGNDTNDINDQNDSNDGNNESSIYFKKKPSYKKSNPKENIQESTIIEFLLDKNNDRNIKIYELNISLNKHFPKVEGDKVTFIGSTFIKYGDSEPYLNHCVVLNTCDNLELNNSQIETYNSERDLLVAWTNLIQKENPDIIIGYNIFGFDYEFMFRRAEENSCIEDFLKLSKNINEICGTKDKNTHRYNIEESKIVIASGEHDLKYIKMNGRIQIDLYNFFRREENLTSYKLDYVAGHFIGDYVKKIDLLTDSAFAVDNKNKSKSNESDIEYQTSKIFSYNLTGLEVGSYIHFEEIGHSKDYYQNGDKFKIIQIDKSSNSFICIGHIQADLNKKIRWCLAKDDVTPKDIFQMTHGSSTDRSIIAKYCIQDCNLVQHLLNKVDVLTGFIEMSKICSVPINFLILRGQGIKLTSYVAKKCREKNTLIPVIEKLDSDDGYEGAIVLEPKCDLYLDNPVACVDYASLYPSSMMSENISHDSKVWTKEYDLEGKLLFEIGEKDDNGNFIYDNLQEYQYIDSTYDTFKYVRKSPSSVAEKIKKGYKICRYAQFPTGRAIMPSILEELLTARKTTRKLIPLQEDEFMKNVLDKRQLGYKLTANSLYGQCGARTSSFYDKDVAASTTATGRLLLTYAKKVIEECYGNRICQTENYGTVCTKAEYIYGDSVANYTPIYILANGKFDIITIETLGEKYGNGIWKPCLELGKQEKEVCEFDNLIQTWTEKGWTTIYRVIRHRLAHHKKMFRILTHSGLVDVTDDHSLICSNGEEISPNFINEETELLHHKLPTNYVLQIVSIFQNNFYNQLDAAIYLNYLNSKGLNCSIIHYDNDFYTIYIDHTKSNNKVKMIKEIKNYNDYVYDLTTENNHFAAGIGDMIVHNTDSVFFTFNLQSPEGEPIRGEKALEITIELAQEAGHLASSFLKGPHDLEYEKTFMPFCLLSKKRYVGMLYEFDPKKGKRKEMGIVLKRRDNAPIVKDIYGGIIDILMKEKDIKKAVDFLKLCLQNIVDENYPIDKLIITKSLRSGYKNPNQIAHKILADRIVIRDPGNKPSSGDRIPFVYIHNQNKKALQGEKIETPMFIKEKNLKIDYSFYITNQIMKPVQQVFALVLEKLLIMNNKKGKVRKMEIDIEKLKKQYLNDLDKLNDKVENLKNKEVKILLFDDFLRQANNAKEKNNSVTDYFRKL